ncbi:ABC transporter permease/substrate-binding protein [bacterium]|nr:ABC transporter permease/substrate-binding protein [bacterium]
MSDRVHDALALLPDYLSGHMSLSIGALLIGLIISLPMALAATRIKSLKLPLLTITSLLQTIPSLALLALMVPLLGRIGFVPALIALILYSMLPIVRNTVAGIEGVDPALTEAARGIGMTDWQMLTRVELPLAAPVILAGIRTATVWVVGIATLSTPVGATSLGNFIFSGLQTQNTTAVLVGVAAAATLAIALDLLIRLLEIAAAKRSFALGLLAGLLLVGGIGGSFMLKLSSMGAGDAPVVRIGTKTFTEQYILAELIGNRLELAGYHVEKVESLGSTVMFEALSQGNLDIAVDYSGTIWANHMQRRDNPGRQAVLDTMTQWLLDEKGIHCLGSLGFENAYAMAMSRERAEKLDILTIADLATHSSNLSIGGDYEFFDRPEWFVVRDTYGLDFSELRRFDSSLMYPAVRDGLVDVIGAFSTDGRILAYNLVVLDDTKGAFPPYDAVLLLSKDAVERGLAEELHTLVGSISNEMMMDANKRVDLDGKSVENAAISLADPQR